MTADKLHHPEWCPAERIETDEHEHVTTVRCLDCGAQLPPDPLNVGPFADGPKPWHDGIGLMSPEESTIDPATYQRKHPLAG